MHGVTFHKMATS